MSQTQLSIRGEQFFINGEVTYKGKVFQGKSIEGYQSVPANWGISSTRKRGFFALLKEITES